VVPLAGSTISRGVTLQWSSTDPEGGPLTYNIYLGTTNPPELVKSGHTSSTYSVGSGAGSDLQQSATYYWKIVAFDQDALSTEGPVWSFNTRALFPPNQPSSPSPASGATGVSRTPTLTWQCTDPDNQPLSYTVR
jgi:hypothetical protein